MTLTLNIIMGGALTGAAFNSARALGPMVAIGNFTNAWLYMIAPLVGAKMKRTLLLATAALGALTISVNARDDRLPAKFVGNWCLAEHTADHLSFYRRGRCTNPNRVDDWLTISPDGFDVHEMHCKVLVAHANKRGDYLVKFSCGDNLIQNYWFSLFNDRLYVSLTDREP